MMTTWSASLVFAIASVGQADAPARDMRAELPRDMRIVLLGVPSVENARIAEENLRRAVALLQDDLSSGDARPDKVAQSVGRVFFRLGQFDEALGALKKSLRNQERVKGLEEYRDLARGLELHAEFLAALSGTSEAPIVSEEGDAAVTKTGAASPTELVKQLNDELPKVSRLLDRIEQRTRPDEERKAQLERDVGAIGQFVFQMRNLADDIREAEAGHGTVRIDTNEIVRGVNGLIDAIRDMKRDRELRTTPEPRTMPDSRSRRRDL